MSPLFQLVLFNNCFIQLLIPWMSPLFQLVLFNFLFRWPPLFGRTFYSTTGFIQQLFYSTAYSLDESLIPTGFIQLFIPMAALIWSHFLFNNFLFNFLFLFNLNYLVTLIITFFFFFFFFFLWKKKVPYLDSNPGPLDLQSGVLTATPPQL